MHWQSPSSPAFTMAPTWGSSSLNTRRDPRCTHVRKSIPQWPAQTQCTHPPHLRILLGSHRRQLSLHSNRESTAGEHGAGSGPALECLPATIRPSGHLSIPQVKAHAQKGAYQCTPPTHTIPAGWQYGSCLPPSAAQLPCTTRPPIPHQMHKPYQAAPRHPLGPIPAQSNALPSPQAPACSRPSIRPSVWPVSQH